MVCGYFEHQRTVQCEECVADTLQNKTAIFPRCMWLVFIFEICDAGRDGRSAQSLKVYVDHIKIHVRIKNIEVLRAVPQVLGKLKAVTQEEEELKLTLTEGGRQGRKEQTHCVDKILSGFDLVCVTQKELAFTSSVEYLDIDVLNPTWELGKKVRFERKIMIKKTKEFRKVHMKKGINKVFEDGSGDRKSLVGVPKL